VISHGCVEERKGGTKIRAKIRKARTIALVGRAGTATRRRQATRCSSLQGRAAPRLGGPTEPGLRPPGEMELSRRRNKQKGKKQGITFRFSFPRSITSNWKQDEVIFAGTLRITPPPFCPRRDAHDFAPAVDGRSVMLNKSCSDTNRLIGEKKEILAADRRPQACRRDVFFFFFSQFRYRARS